MRPAFPFRIIQPPAAGDWTTDATSLPRPGPPGRRRRDTMTKRTPGVADAGRRLRLVVVGAEPLPSSAPSPGDTGLVWAKPVQAASTPEGTIP